MHEFTEHIPVPLTSHLRRPPRATRPLALALLGFGSTFRMRDTRSVTCTRLRLGLLQIFRIDEQFFDSQPTGLTIASRFVRILRELSRLLWSTVARKCFDDDNEEEHIIDVIELTAAQLGGRIYEQQ